MIASLPMYWQAENAAHWRAFWAVLQICARDQGLNLPPLTPPEQLGASLMSHWQRPDLALSMTCALPYRRVLRDRVAYIGTLDFGLEGPMGHYHSVIIQHSPGQRGPLRLATNSRDSQSGWAAVTGRFAHHLETGSHAGALHAVAQRRADIAWIDAVSWRLLRRGRPDLASRVRVVARTGATPGLPLIAARGTNPGPLRSALSAAVARFHAPDPAALGGRLGFAVLNELMYRRAPLQKATQRHHS